MHAKVFTLMGHPLDTVEVHAVGTYMDRPHLKQGPSGFVGVLAALVRHGEAVHLRLAHKDAVQCLFVCLLCTGIQICIYTLTHYPNQQD